jgi:hypothetical protein
LKGREDEHLVYDTGHLTLYVIPAEEPRPPVLSFTVPDLEEAKAHLARNGAEVIVERGSSLWFRDPFGIVHDVIEGEE